MLKKAPTPINFIICEDIRQEAGNKVSLLGVYSDGIVFEATPENTSPPMRVAQLAIYATFGNLEAACALDFKIVDPNGKVTFKSPHTEQLKSGDGVTMVGCKFVGLEFKKQGTHKVVFLFDDKPVEFNFTVSIDRTKT